MGLTPVVGTMTAKVRVLDTLGAERHQDLLLPSRHAAEMRPLALACDSAGTAHKDELSRRSCSPAETIA